MRVGVIGTGNMGENHVRTYLLLHEHCQLVGIYDNDEKKRRQISKKYKVKEFQSIHDLLQCVDAVSITVPTEFHYDVGLICIKHGVHMLMEKPITSTVAQAKDLNKKAIEAGIKLQVGHIELFNPLIKALARELANRDIIGIDFHRLSPYNERIKNVDVVKDLMIHDIYILQNLLKDKLLEFYTLGKVIENTPKHAVVIMESPQGAIAQLTASFKSKRKIRTIQILTEDALFETDILKNEIKITKDTELQTIKLNNDIKPLNNQLLDFINCIRYKREPLISGKDGIKALVITNEISEILNKE
ncbi:Gfo/Idh/MocA family protein [Virgibacillus halodenitrificans]|uniref:Gfo/Idh/MocA family protein n=1 Tax=Virgibacillus halodenitrificans TaxID=1482 RepID=UPI001F352A6C|nr:Gfo/Idh/MocA family oxidoreductase [Virgibacillus halodenitrificans]